MADRVKLEKFVRMMESEHDGEALNALRMIKRMAAAEKKNLAELLLNPNEKVVYRDRPGSPDNGSGGFDWRKYQDDIYREANAHSRARREQAERERQDRRRAERAAREEARRERYRGAFDDAEMTDEERAAARARRAEREQNKGRRAFTDDRDILDALRQAYEDDDGDLTHWEKEFAGTLPFQYTHDWQLSDRQIEQAEKIIRKVRRNQKGSPI